jgi:predicted aldo/keto reductase-like oxidoreductase
MEYRPLGRSGLSVSAVGFGTSQLRRVTTTQAIDTVLAGFEAGVNIVHTAPDYEGSEDVIAVAVRRCSRPIIVACNGYDVQYNRAGRVRLFEKLFESTCRRLGADRLDLFGIASVDDREAFAENVWGRKGMVEFLLRMKAKGRIRATFCTSHGRPEFSAKLIESGAFDAVMLAYNDLGFHSLSQNPSPGRHFEDLSRTKSELFSLCHKHGVGLMIMMPLAGGLLCPSKAFAPPPEANQPASRLTAADFLRSILEHSEVSCVLPGTASVTEARENATAGQIPVRLSEESRQSIRLHVADIQTTLCSRCGHCEPLCSQSLPISWMFRAGQMSLTPASPYETWEEVEYFRLHPSIESACATCTNVTCACPAGIDIPKALISLHGKMLDHMQRGLIAPPVHLRPPDLGNRWFSARIVRYELPQRLSPGEQFTCRVFVENLGVRRWHAPGVWHGSTVRLEVVINGIPLPPVNLRDKVIENRRCHFLFQITAPADVDHLDVELFLARHHRLLGDRHKLKLLYKRIAVTGSHDQPPSQ